MTDPCDLVAYPEGGAGQWNADGVLTAVIVSVEADGDVSPYVTLQATLDGASVFYLGDRGKPGETLQVRAAPDVNASTLYVTSGWPGGETCDLVFERESAPAPVDVTQAEYPPSTPVPNAGTSLPPKVLAETGPTFDPSLIVALAMMLVVAGLMLLWLGRKERRQERTILSDIVRGDD